jgi:hypothetical protein
MRAKSITFLADVGLVVVAVGAAGFAEDGLGAVSGRAAGCADETVLAACKTADE